MDDGQVVGAVVVVVVKEEVGLEEEALAQISKN